MWAAILYVGLPALFCGVGLIVIWDGIRHKTFRTVQLPSALDTMNRLDASGLTGGQGQRAGAAAE